jgi:drug/metabolite transporter (DMT)-like permease
MARSLGADARAPVMAFYANSIYLAAGLGLAALLARASPGGVEDRSLAFLVRAWSYPAPPDLALLAACGVIAAVGTVLLTQAYRTARASTVAPFEYSSLVWGVAFGWLVWGDWPDPTTWVGIAVIVACGLYLLRHTMAGT